METFETMVEKGCVPNKITYNILTESLCKAGKVNEALDLVDEILNKGITPDTVSFATIISGFANNGDLKGAYQLFRRMGEQYKVSHTTATYNIMINAFAEKLDLHMGEKLFLEMGAGGCAPDTYTYRVMIDGFCITGNTDSGYKFLLEMIEKGFIPSLTTFGRVINCLCVQHRVHEAVDIIHFMVHNGIVPEVVNSISEADKKVVAAPKIVVEDLLKRSCITYYAYELLYDGIRDKKTQKQKLPNRH
jgi:pentatricopeptide repeat protein